MQNTDTTRKVVYYIAMTVDHYIAHEDGGIEGFAADGHYIADYINSLRDYDTVLMGRSTYEFGYQYGIQPGQAVPTYGHMMQYVFSRSMEAFDNHGLKVVQSDAADFVCDLKTQGGGDIYLCGGGRLAGTLLDAGLVDELILKLNPVVFGGGIPVFGGLCEGFDLSLLDTKVYNNGVVFLHYALK